MLSNPTKRTQCNRINCALDSHFPIYSFFFLLGKHFIIILQLPAQEFFHIGLESFASILANSVSHTAVSWSIQCRNITQSEPYMRVMAMRFCTMRSNSLPLNRLVNVLKDILNVLSTIALSQNSRAKIQCRCPISCVAKFLALDIKCRHFKLEKIRIKTTPSLDIILST